MIKDINEFQSDMYWLEERLDAFLGIVLFATQDIETCLRKYKDDKEIKKARKEFLNIWIKAANARGYIIEHPLRKIKVQRHAFIQ